MTSNQERYAHWERSGAFITTDDPSTPAFSMILPPPNITGTLHMGHAYEHTLSDAIIRYRRMQGDDALWLPGLDHASIATNALLERKLQAEGSSRLELGRERFLNRAWEWKETCQTGITEQMRELGTSPEWERLSFTMDEGPSLATRTAFKQLYDEGLIYRDTRETLWCPGCTTTISDIEADETPEGAACSRCRTLLEERTTPQWYLRTQGLAERAQRAQKSGETLIEPAEGAEEYLRWAGSMHDWCISRQLWWGHRIPIWYGPGGETRSFGPEETIPEGWEQDEDTLDTWFSSALWPLSTLGWPRESAQLERYYPNALLITGNDLIFFWALRMMMLCTHLTGKAPFKRILLHGMIRDADGKKMSKSFGNTIDPLEWIEAHGADNLRLALARKSRPGADIPAFGDEDRKWARGYLAKLRSITSLAERLGCWWDRYPDGEAEHLLDRWLLDRCRATIEQASDGYESGDLAETISALETFAERDLSSLYLEARKDALYAGEEGALRTLSAALTALLTVLHPLAPFTTEELAEELGWSGILDEEAWPHPAPADPEGAEAGEQLRELLEAARSHRARQGFPAGERLPARLEGIELTEELYRMAKLAPGDPETATTIRRRGGELALPSAPTLDEERRRQLERRLQEQEELIERLSARLEDPQFLERAPIPAQEKSRRDLEAAEHEARRFRELLG